MMYIHDTKKDIKHAERHMSQHMREKAKGGYLSVKFYGHDIYIPITKEMKRVFDIHTNDGTLYFQSQGTQNRVDIILSDVCMALYLQLRDVIGSEISSNVMQDVNYPCLKARA